MKMKSDDAGYQSNENVENTNSESIATDDSSKETTTA